VWWRIEVQPSGVELRYNHLVWSLVYDYLQSNTELSFEFRRLERTPIRQEPFEMTIFFVWFKKKLFFKAESA
jgi:hypothetical protein